MQCCESKSGLIRNLFPDPKLFVLVLDPARIKERKKMFIYYFRLDDSGVLFSTSWGCEAATFWF